MFKDMTAICDLWDKDTSKMDKEEKKEYKK